MFPARQRQEKTARRSCQIRPTFLATMKGPKEQSKENGSKYLQFLPHSSRVPGRRRLRRRRGESSMQRMRDPDPLLLPALNAVSLRSPLLQQPSTADA
jgi:hypothetical protein